MAVALLTHLLFPSQAVQESIANGHILSDVLSGRQRTIYLPNQAGLRQAFRQDLSGRVSVRGLWDWCPEEAGSILMEGISRLTRPDVVLSEQRGEGTGEPSGAAVPTDPGLDSRTSVPLGTLILFGSPSAPPSQRDLLWAKAIAGKLYLALTARKSSADVALAP